MGPPGTGRRQIPRPARTEPAGDSTKASKANDDEGSYYKLLGLTSSADAPAIEAAFPGTTGPEGVKRQELGAQVFVLHLGNEHGEPRQRLFFVGSMVLVAGGLLGTYVGQLGALADILLRVLLLLLVLDARARLREAR